MTQTIKIIFGLSKDGKNLFYVQVGSDRYFTIYEDEAEDELNYGLIKSTLEPTREGVEYIQKMYKRWLEEYVKCKK